MPSVTRIVKFIRKGDKGDPGRSVLSVDVEYAQGDSNVEAPKVGWNTDPPAWIVEKYIWSRTRIDYSDGEPDYTDPVCISGSSVIDIKEEYYRSTSANYLSGGEWKELRPTWINGYYIWTRSHVILTDRDYYTAAICVTGAKGTNGKTYYTWIKYADSIGSSGYPDSMYDTPTKNTAYIGIAKNQVSSTEGTDPSVYVWAKIKGEDGADGTSFKAKGSADGHFASLADYSAASKIINHYYLVDIPDTTTYPDGACVMMPTNRGDATYSCEDGDAYTTTDKHLWVKDGGYWIDLGEIQGPKGDPGQPGPPGPPGRVGPSLRGPQQWDKVDVGYQFYQGAEGEPYKDVVIWNGNYYSCVKSHTKTDSNHPLSSDDDNYGYWQTTDKVEIVATQILLSTYALVENLGVGVIEMKDKSGKVVFSAKDGKVECLTGTFNGIEVQSGKIAGFKIDGNRLTNESFYNDATVVFRNDKRNTYAGIGGNVYAPASGFSTVSRFVNEYMDETWGSVGINCATILSAKNGAKNYAFIGNGNGLLDGYIAGYSFHKYTIKEANTIFDGEEVLNLRKSNQFFVHCEKRNSGICLPRLYNVCDALGIKSGTNFCLKITIMSDLGTTQKWVVRGRTTIKDSSGGTPWDNDEFPWMMNTDGVSFSDCEMGSGDSLQIMLVYDSSQPTINKRNTMYTARIINRQD